MSAPQGWEGILAEGEAILWQDRPHGGVVWQNLLRPESVMGVVFTGFSVFWVLMAASITQSAGGLGGIFPLFGLPFIAIGLYLLIGRIFWDAYVRSRTWYTLTNRTAYVASTGLLGRSLKPYPIRDMNALELDDDTPGTVWFQTETRRHTIYRSAGVGNRGFLGNRTGTTVTKIGFRRIDDARRVYRLIADARDQA